MTGSSTSCYSFSGASYPEGARHTRPAASAKACFFSLLAAPVGGAAGAEPGRLTQHLNIGVADPAAFGLHGSRPSAEYPAAHVQTPSLLAFAAKVNQLLAEARSFGLG